MVINSKENIKFIVPPLHGDRYDLIENKKIMSSYGWIISQLVDGWDSNIEH